MLEFIKNLLWNYMFVPLFILAGILCFTVLVCKKKKGSEKTISEGSDGEVSPLQTLFVTLASTIGTGNIIGVSLAIAYGGAGAVFWMWVAAFLGMCVSYCENALGKRYQPKGDKPIGYMPDSVAKVFAFFCIPASLGIGNMIQSNSAANALFTGFNTQKWITGLLFSLLAFIIIKGGLKGIAKFTDFFVPVMSLFYIVSVLLVIIINREAVGEVLQSIFKEAFSMKAVISGSVATGIARGVLSGEAGIGSTVMLSSRSNAKSPHVQGLVGATAIFIDTFVICTLTAFAILTSNAKSTQSAFYMALGNIGGGILDLSIAFFAFTTVIGWSYFGTVCAGYLWGDKAKEAYKWGYAICVFIGAIAQLELVWGIADIASALMAIPNLLCVIFFVRKIKSI